MTGIAAIVILSGCALAPAPAERPETATCPPQVPCPACPACPPSRPQSEAARYEPRNYGDLPGWTLGGQAQALRAFLESCPRLPQASPLKRACDGAATIPSGNDAAARNWLEKAFTPYAVIAPSDTGDGLITGYYEPILPGSRTRSARFRYPVHGTPEDLVSVDLSSVSPETRHLRLRGRLDGRRLVPYWSRAEIEARASELPAPVLAWVEDPVELFFLQIQGSGLIDLENGGRRGERIRLGYADQNGHPYRSLGRYLVGKGEMTLDMASMQGIMAWAAANPAKLQEARNFNASYVFFRELPAQGGPLGALGAPLSAGTSLAVDPRYIPLGAPLFLATTYPLSDRPLERLMVAQDTGGAIRGVVRGDFYWGSGAEAGLQAGRMRQRGRYWLLWPRGEPLPRLQ
ncbi:MAG: transglycosylase [Betaproteobacteria bacterium]|nr:transglycosylase [Betaproteobacteria bacterium]